MLTRRRTLGIIASAFAQCLPVPVSAAPAEPDILHGRLSDGTLPPMAMRLPKQPRVVDVAAMGRQPGRYGGSVRMLIGGQKDIRLMTINGYARLVGYDRICSCNPTSCERFERRGPASSPSTCAKGIAGPTAAC